MDKIKGVIFDFDGTLVQEDIDFENMRNSLKLLAGSLGLRVPEAGMPALELIERIRKDNRKSGRRSGFLEKAARIIEKYEVEASRTAAVVPGVPELIAGLVRNGFKIGIVSRNCRKVVGKLLKTKKIFCHSCLTRDQVKNVKPHPEHLDLMRKSLALKKTEILVAGDHPFDVQAARKIGMTSCGVLSGGKNAADFEKEGADLILPNAADLKTFLGLEPLKQGKLPLELLRYLLKKYSRPARDIITGPGIGVDAAVIKNRSGLLAATMDPVSLVAKDTGLYAVAVNANDLAVSGAKPKWLLATLIVPPETFFPQVEEIFSGIFTTCGRLGIAVAGGHTEISGAVNKPVLSCCLLGIPLKTKQVKSAAEGDSLILVKEAGIEGSSIIAREKESVLRKKSPALWEQAKNAVASPGISVVDEALGCLERFPVIRMHDPTEGGIADAVYELAAALKTGFIIEEKKIPVFPAARKLAETFSLDVLGLISSGCLLIAAKKKDTKRILEYYRRKGIAANEIGRAVRTGEVSIIRKNGAKEKLPFFESDEVTKIYPEQAEIRNRRSSRL